ncbi:hypothetical protein [Nonomuraea lactucae]|uniref:hypothetical protein n=1 Tax=Nonomuraea lactucae TaxID=2249762 RepID=UPI000DE4A056|nr:hypothetical protein [Nonomuraea lactucae]
MRRGIYLLEEVDFRPMNSRRPLEYLTWLTRYKREDETRERPELTSGMSIRSREIDLAGAFYAVGITGHPQFKAVTLWECHGGWDGGWRQMMDIYRGVDDRLFLSDIDDLRFSAFSRPLGAVRGTPSPAEVVPGEFYVFESARVRPGAAPGYLEAVRAERAPLLAEHGHRLAGLYEVLFCDTEAVTLWAVSLDDHLATLRARDAALGLDDEVEPDDRLLRWDKRARDFLDGPWRETLLAPFPGSRLAPGG